MKYTITKTPKGKKTLLTVTDETGKVIGTRTSNRSYGFAVIVQYDPKLMAHYFTATAKSARAKAEQYRQQQIKGSPAYLKACKEFRQELIDESIDNGDYAAWATKSDEYAIKCDAEAIAWEQGTAPNEPWISSWSSTLANTQDAADSRLKTIAIATL